MVHNLFLKTVLFNRQNTGTGRPKNYIVILAVHVPVYSPLRGVSYPGGKSLVKFLPLKYSISEFLVAF